MISGDAQEDHEYCEIVAQWKDENLLNRANYNPAGPSTLVPAEVQDEINKLKAADPGVLKQIASYISNDRTLKSLLQQKVGYHWLTNHTLREASISFLMTQPSDALVGLDGEPLILRDSSIDPSSLYGHDELYVRAVQVVISSQRASTSLLQRRLRVGYARAARIIDQMEREGIVAPPDGARPRDVLVKDFEEVQSTWNKLGAQL